MSKILDISTDLQIPNRILKDDTNKVKQITDKAQNIVFSQGDSAKQPVYNYDGYYDFMDSALVGTNSEELEIGENYFFSAWINLPSLTNFTCILSKGHYNTGTSYVFYIQNNYLYLRLGTDIQTYIDVGYSDLNNRMTIDTWHHISFQKIGGIYSAFMDGKFYKRNENSTPLFTTPTEQVRIGEWSPVAGLLNGYISNIIIEDAIVVPDFSAGFGDKIFEPEGREFLYYHRYKDDGNKKLYLSSKYLKDAVIDENNSISEIYDSIGNVEYFAPLNPPVLTNQGFQFTVSDYLGTNNQYDNYPSGIDFFMGCWIKSNTVSSPWKSIMNYGGLDLKLENNGDHNVMVFTNPAGDIIDFTKVYPDGKYNYSSVLCKNGIVYFFLNGILTHFEAYEVTAGTEPIFRVCRNNFNGYADDFLVSIDDSIIYPTGYSVGQKVFEPPRRGGFGGEFKQYPIPT